MSQRRNPETASERGDGGRSPTGSGRPEVGPLTLLFMVATGPAVWAVHLAGSAALVPLSCRNGARWPINLLTVASAAVIAAAMMVSARVLRSTGGPDAERAPSGLRLWAFGGLAWGAISLAVTLLEGAPNLVLRTCPL